MTQDQQRDSAVTLKRNGLAVECVFAENGKLARKMERYDRQFVEYAYQYDAKGHLTKVRRDGVVTESYEYNQPGRRVECKREYRGFSDSVAGRLLYDESGRLFRAGDTTFSYDKRGALAERRDRQGIARYAYGKDTMPDSVILPCGKEIRYEYEASNPIGPARRFRSGALSAELTWSNPLQLAAYKDHDTLLDYTFLYDNAGILNKIRIVPFKAKSRGPEHETGRAAASSDWLETLVTQKKQQRLHDFLGRRSGPLELLCGCDQVGSLNILTDTSGNLVKEILRDSFGVQQADSFPDLFMPIGFAGGLVDPDTGLVRFGYRDYDPGVGRFTAPDPARDRRGDGDLYDYCVDDPVSCVDPAGLAWFLPALYSGAVALAEAYPLLAGAGGAAGALGLGLGGSYLAAAAADGLGNKYAEFSGIQNRRPRNKSAAAWDGVNKVALDVAATHAAAFLPLAGFVLPEAAAAANAALEAMGPKAIGVAMAATGAAVPSNTLEMAAHWGAKAVEGGFVPGTPDPKSWPAMGAWILRFLRDESQKHR